MSIEIFPYIPTSIGHFVAHNFVLGCRRTRLYRCPLRIPVVRYGLKCITGRSRSRTVVPVSGGCSRCQFHTYLARLIILYIPFLVDVAYLTWGRWASLNILGCQSHLLQTLPSCLWSLRIFPSLPCSGLQIFYCDASSALLHLVNRSLNSTYVLTFSRFPLQKPA